MRNPSLVSQCHRPLDEEVICRPEIRQRRVFVDWNRQVSLIDPAVGVNSPHLSFDGSFGVEEIDQRVREIRLRIRVFGNDRLDSEDA